MSDDWLALLRARVAEIGVGPTAREIGISRTSVDLLIKERYPANTDRMAARVIDRYTRHECPYDGALLHSDACARYAGKAPTSSPAALRRWRACQKCTFNPNQKDTRSPAFSPADMRQLARFPRPATLTP